MIETTQRKNGATMYRATLQIAGEPFRSPWMTDRAEAALWENRLRVDVADGRKVTGDDMTLRQFGDDWLEHQKAATVKGSWVKERSNLDKHLYPRWGSTKLKAFDPMTFQKWIDDQRDAMSDNKRDDLIRCIKQVLGRAVAWKVISSNPLAGIDRIRLMETQVEVYTADELTTMFHWLADRKPEVLDVAQWAINTGMRLGEIVAMRWSDINDRMTAATVCRQWDAKVLKYVERTKGKTIRQVPLNRECRRTLERLAMQNRQPEGRIFSADYYHVTRDWTRWLVDSGLKVAEERGCTFHCLRHTFASWFMQEGGNIYDLQKILGHASVTTTEKRYLRFDPAHLAGKTDRIGFSISDGAQVVRLGG